MEIYTGTYVETTDVKDGAMPLCMGWSHHLTGSSRSSGWTIVKKWSSERPPTGNHCAMKCTKLEQ